MTEVQHNPYLIVLRSLTKFYALSGLRIGYGVFPLNITETIKKHKEPWTVNPLAQTAGIAAFKDAAYKKRLQGNQAGKISGKNSKDLRLVTSVRGKLLFIKDSPCKRNKSALRNKGILVKGLFQFQRTGWKYMRIAVR